MVEIGWWKSRKICKKINSIFTRKKFFLRGCEVFDIKILCKKNMFPFTKSKKYSNLRTFLRVCKFFIAKLEVKGILKKRHKYLTKSFLRVKICEVARFKCQNLRGCEVWMRIARLVKSKFKLAFQEVVKWKKQNFLLQERRLIFWE